MTSAANEGAKPARLPKLRFRRFGRRVRWRHRLQQLGNIETQKNRDGAIVRVLTNSSKFGVVDRAIFSTNIAAQGNLDGYFVVELANSSTTLRISATGRWPDFKKQDWHWRHVAAVRSLSVQR